MAKIFVSHSVKDEELVNRYITFLKVQHEIFIDNALLNAQSNMQETLMKAQADADGTLVFLTANAGNSRHVNSEIGLARSYYDHNKKFLIVMKKANVNVPYVIADMPVYELEENNIEESIKTINKAIEENQLTQRNQSAKATEKVSDFSADGIARMFRQFLIDRPHKTNTKKQDWILFPNTERSSNASLVFDTKNQFEFAMKDYRFRLNFIWKGASYQQFDCLTLESLNLDQQLAKLDIRPQPPLQDGRQIADLVEIPDVAWYNFFSRITAYLKNAGADDTVHMIFDGADFPGDKFVSDLLNWAGLREEAQKSVIGQKRNAPNQPVNIDPIPDPITKNKNADPDPSGKITSASGYWLLKIYGDDWELASFDDGSVGHFNSTFNSFEKRPDYNFFEKVKPGDKGVAYDYSSATGIVFFFEIIQGLHPDEKREEIITFKIEPLQQRIALEVFTAYIDFTTDLGRESIRKLFPLPVAAFEAIVNNVAAIQPEVTVTYVPNKVKLSTVFADNAKDPEDELGFTGDINALASVIAYKEVTPPLAIGLFGNWGSGKSFFMNKLQLAINDLAKDTTNRFCKKVLQINFNSWHYSDSNLWASLITKIFEDLEIYGAKKPDELKELYDKLNSTTELLAETTVEKTRIDKEIGALQEQQKILNDKVQKQSDNLDSLSLPEILKGLMQSTTVQQEFDKLKKDYAFLNLTEYDSINDDLRKLDDFTEKSSQSFKLFISFLKGKKWMAVLLLLLLTAAIAGLSTHAGFFKQYLGDYKGLIVLISGLMATFVQFMQPAIKIVNDAFARLTKLNRSVEDLKVNAKAKFINQQEDLSKRLSDATKAADNVQQQIELLKVQQQKLQSDIDEISSGKKIIRFIESRVSDQRYINSLGIISWVRKDFDQLNELLVQQRTAQAQAKKNAPKPIAFELERIILYIDDLDRCNETIVVKVLEAMHLLLAYPLFVVVVGVDPRWMHNALNLQYSKLLAGNTNNADPAHSPLVSESGHPATSYDYLEKIFQIPFALKPIDATGKADLIRSQFEVSKVDKVDEVDKADKNIEVQSENKANIEANKESGRSTEEAAGIQLDVATGQPIRLDELLKQPETIKEDESTNAKTDPATLEVSAEEIEFMQSISFMIGESPRTIKRYINMYRIIRTHSQFKTEAADPMKYYMAAIILLAVITGLPEAAAAFFEALRSENKHHNFQSFLKKYADETNPKPDGRFWLLANNVEIKKLKQSALLKTMTADHFQCNMELVGRFSFRNI
ncbi:MAG: P-loop NTPase fold protein [Ferruginibacter sp.]